MYLGTFFKTLISFSGICAFPNQIGHLHNFLPSCCPAGEKSICLHVGTATDIRRRCASAPTTREMPSLVSLRMNELNLGVLTDQLLEKFLTTLKFDSIQTIGISWYETFNKYFKQYLKLRTTKLDNLEVLSC